MAVVAVPVTFPVIPPIKLDAATAVAVKTPTMMSGVPDNPRAVFATPAIVLVTVSEVVVTTPVERFVVVTIPRFKFGFNFVSGNIGSLLRSTSPYLSSDAFN